MNIILLISIFLFCLSFFFYQKIRKKKVSLEQDQKKKQQIENQIKQLKESRQVAEKECNFLIDLKKQKRYQVDYLNDVLRDKEEYHQNLISKINDLKQKSNNFYDQEKKIVDQQLKRYKENSNKAASNYFDVLEKSYETAEAAHIQKMTRLKEEQTAAAASLNKIVQTRNQAHAALLKQRQIKQNKDNYRLAPSVSDLQDIHSLERIKQTLHKPRVLSMLIWQTFWQPIAKKQFPIILKDKTKMGIYKITNTQTDQSYIGQSVDIYKRWCQHCKAGLGIDTPVGNKLYKAIQEYGLENFTFQLLCQCQKEQLDEKEKYFIELYQANTFGYNSTIGNK